MPRLRAILLHIIALLSWARPWTTPIAVFVRRFSKLIGGISAIGGLITVVVTVLALLGFLSPGEDADVAREEPAAVTALTSRPVASATETPTTSLGGSSADTRAELEGVTFLRDLQPISTSGGGGASGDGTPLAVLSPSRTFGEVSYRLYGRFDWFEAEIRVEGTETGVPVRHHFEVSISSQLGTPRQIFGTERPLGPTDAPKSIKLDVQGAEFLSLRVEAEITGNVSTAWWGDARLIESQKTPVSSPCPGEYVVREGDSPVSIADMCEVRLDELLAANGLTGDDFLQPGDVLMIPR